MILRGVAASGLGKATWFTGLPWVRGQLIERLHIEPYPGTFNVRLAEATELRQWEAVQRRPGVAIAEIAETSCAAVCYPVLVNERVRGAILVPGVPGYPPDQVEVVAPDCLRETLGLKDGDAVTLRLLESGVPTV